MPRLKQSKSIVKTPFQNNQKMEKSKSVPILSQSRGEAYAFAFRVSAAVSSAPGRERGAEEELEASNVGHCRGAFLRSLTSSCTLQKGRNGVTWKRSVWEKTDLL